MATWIAHIRLAQNLLDYGFQLAVEPFLIGNIAPDSGIQDEQGNWSPPKKITHWQDINWNIQPEDFYEQYLANKTANLSEDEYAFLMGYYCHLVADTEWIGQIWQPMSRFPEWQAVINNPDDNDWTIKKDWYGQDFIYLRDNPETLYTSVFKQVAACPDYLSYLAEGAILRSVNRIRDYYENEESKQLSYAHNYPYLDKHGMDSYVECTTIVLIALLEAKGVPCPNPRPLSAYGIRLVA
jgi:sarcosine oxidase delta subunit